MRNTIVGMILSISVFSAVEFALGQDAQTTFVIPAPPGKHCPVSSEQLRDVVSYRADQRIVGTHFFYWYDIDSKLHFVDYDGTDALTDHPLDSNGYSYKSAAWWKRELLDVMAADIDFILPVYWGSPGDYHSWSFEGLPRLVEAWDELVREGKQPPRIGLFYDTSTLQFNTRNWHVSLDSNDGKAWFYTTIRDFFSHIPPRMWAAIEGRPIVVLYSANFAKKQDPATFPDARKRFQSDFGTDMYLVKEVSWEGPADKVCAWGGALGLKPYSVASLGPGYDHSAVPGRTPLIADRRGGQFYRQQWEQLLSYGLKRRATMVLVETWNELHEGTDVCASTEYGRQYIELTAKYAKQFRNDVLLPKTGPFANVTSVSWNAIAPGAENGMQAADREDGMTVSIQHDGRAAIRSRNTQHAGKYLYFEVADSFAFDESMKNFELEIDYFDEGFDALSLEYDSSDFEGSVREGAFKGVQAPPIKCGHSRAWKKVHWSLADARFANRCNGADWRIAVLGGDVMMSKATLSETR